LKKFLISSPFPDTPVVLQPHKAFQREPAKPSHSLAKNYMAARKCHFGKRQKWPLSNAFSRQKLNRRWKSFITPSPDNDFNQNAVSR